MDFGKPDWNLFTNNAPELNKSKPVGPEDLVAADGACAAAEAAPSPVASAPHGAASATEAGAAGQAGATALAAAPEPPPDRLEPPGTAGPVAAVPSGGVALGMTECQVVRRAGRPQTVTIGADAGGGRTAVVTYLAGNWPGIYHFDAGRLKEIDQAPQPTAPEKPQKKAKKKKPAKPKTAGTAPRVYVQ